MKTLIVIGAVVVALAVMACPVFASSIIEEDENEIMARHEKRMETVVKNVGQMRHFQTAGTTEQIKAVELPTRQPDVNIDDPERMARSEEVRYAGRNETAEKIGLDQPAELAQRKVVEAQIELKGNGKNYTVSPQMADAPKEGVRLQKKH